MKKVHLTQTNGAPLTLNLAENGVFITKNARKFFSLRTEEIKSLTEEFNRNRTPENQVLYKHKKPFWENNTEYIYLTAANDKDKRLKLNVTFHGYYSSGGEEDTDYIQPVTKLDIGGVNHTRSCRPKTRSARPLKTGWRIFIQQWACPDLKSKSANVTQIF